MKIKVTESRHFNYSASGLEGRVRLKFINNTQAGDGRVVAHGDFSMAQFFNCRYIINPLIAPYVKLLTVCFLGKKILSHPESCNKSWMFKLEDAFEPWDPAQLC